MITLDLIDSATASVEVKTAAGQALTIDGSGFITSNINGTVTVSATDLDIRDLTSASDSVEIKTAAGQALAIDGSGFLTISNSSFAVTATDLDIRDLTHVSDSVKIGDGTDFLAINADGSINATVQLDNISTWKNTVEAPTGTAAELVSTPLANRTSLTIQNVGGEDVWIGPDGTVTNTGATRGLKIPRNSSADLKFDATANVFAITDGGTGDITVTEYAA